ncbi:hypothetical protein HYPSUDRAFT_46942 [Hypholoma sublateritium FD-334 SS-4]|uniref:Uncharacterized protein n=1 Tax=Hypholoma sublateritium (strain FD-334 SS-4) TaxID=945553 RepID=A0A0D2P971_HYPSF|nr:hypothetical protein HYPSUDRAFT_46942 [Hypholoma sublateritium FD-334 SS-4]
MIHDILLYSFRADPLERSDYSSSRRHAIVTRRNARRWPCLLAGILYSTHPGKQATLRRRCCFPTHCWGATLYLYPSTALSLRPQRSRPYSDAAVPAPSPRPTAAALHLRRRAWILQVVLTSPQFLITIPHTPALVPARSDAPPPPSYLRGAWWAGLIPARAPHGCAAGALR